MRDTNSIPQLTRAELEQKLRQREAELKILTGVQLGLAERLDAQDEYFTPARLKPLLARGGKPLTVVAEVKNQLEEFTRGAKQFDDIAMLVVGRA